MPKLRSLTALIAGLTVCAFSGCTSPGGGNFVTPPDTRPKLSPFGVMGDDVGEAVTWINFTYSPVQAYEFIRNSADDDKRFRIYADLWGKNDTDINSGTGFLRVEERANFEGQISDTVISVNLREVPIGHGFAFWHQTRTESYFDLTPDSVELNVRGTGINTTRLRPPATNAARFLRFDDLIIPTFNPYNQTENDPNSQINPWLLPELIMQDENNSFIVGDIGSEEYYSRIEITGDGGPGCFKIVPFTIPQLPAFTGLYDADYYMQFIPDEGSYPLGTLPAANILILNEQGRPIESMFIETPYANDVLSYYDGYNTQLTETDFTLGEWDEFDLIPGKYYAFISNYSVAAGYNGTPDMEGYFRVLRNVLDDDTNSRTINNDG